jgi:hypothetical protein
MVTVEVPELVSAMLAEVDCPATTSPKVTLVGFAVNTSVETVPVPLKGIVSDGLEALLVI